MNDINAITKDPGRREGLCPHCGADADWSFTDSSRTTVEVLCADCGRFELPASEFDQAEADIVGPSEF
ncbi:MAG: hypothetical protein ACK5AZ_12770 [Bryobacteraceae bacterium]